MISPRKMDTAKLFLAMTFCLADFGSLSEAGDSPLGFQLQSIRCLRGFSEDGI